MTTPTVNSVENLSKVYRLGVIGGRTLSGNLDRCWPLFRGKPDPYLEIGRRGQRVGLFTCYDVADGRSRRGV